MDTKSRTTADLSAYQKEWNAVLGRSNSSGVFVGLSIAFFLFICLISLPWIMAYLQDEGKIKPRIYFNEALELNSHLRTHNEMDASQQPNTFSQPSVSPQPDASNNGFPFGQPRQE